MKFRPGFESVIIQILLLSSLCVACPSTASSAAQTDGSFKLRVDVDLVTVEVSVLDGKGNPVRNLTRDDFRVYEDGKEQEVLSFDAVDGDAIVNPSSLPVIDAGNMPRGKTVLLIFDGSIPAEHLQTVRDSAARFVREHMRPQDFFAVASWGGTMKIVLNLTDDKETVLAAIAQSPPGWGLFENMLPSLEEINRSIASIKGPKSILIFGRSSSLYAGAVLQDKYRRVLDSARKANVIYYAFYPADINVPVPGSSQIDASVKPPEQADAVPPAPRRVIQPAAYNVNTLANDSGGFYVNDPGRMDASLDKIGRQAGNYYILGFQSSNRKHSGDFRKLKVTTRVKGANLKYPPGYQDRRPIDVLASSQQEQRLLTALATPETAVQLPVIFRPAYFYDSATMARVLVAAKIRTVKMAFRKQEGRLVADLNVMGAAYAENGGIAAKFNETVQVGVEREKEAEFRKKDFAYRNYFKVRPGKYRLKLAVTDESGSLGSMEQLFEIPALPEQGIAVSSLIVAERTPQLPPSIQNLRRELLDRGDPLLYPGIQVEPCVDNRVATDLPISVLFRVYDAVGMAGRDLVAAPRLLDANGRKFELPPNSLKEILAAAGPLEAVVGLQLPFKEVPPGKYRLVINVTDKASPQSATLETDLELVPSRSLSEN